MCVQQFEAQCLPKVYIKKPNSHWIKSLFIIQIKFLETNPKLYSLLLHSRTNIQPFLWLHISEHFLWEKRQLISPTNSLSLNQNLKQIQSVFGLSYHKVVNSRHETKHWITVTIIIAIRVSIVRYNNWNNKSKVIQKNNLIFEFFCDKTWIESKP